MTVLVAAASKHEATWEIAQAIGEVLTARGLLVDTRRLTDRDGPDPQDYAAVVLGSAVYLGDWLPAARQYVEAHRSGLATRPLWLFSSGPVGIPGRPADAEWVRIEPIREGTQARDHRLFGGRLDRSRLGVAERIAVFTTRAEDGDGRDFDEIREWAGQIADTLCATPR